MTIETSEPDFGLPSEREGGCNLHIVLVNPEIPPNTGNIARLAAGTNAWLHLVKPLGFELKDKYVRRAGLDYWPAVRLSVHESLAELEPLLPNGRTWLFTKYAETLHTKPAYGRAPVLVFGSESSGLPAPFKEKRAGELLRIPTTGDVRSLNLSNAVAVASYEVLRQQGWSGETPMES